MQMHSSYIVTDPKGTVLIDFSRWLHENIDAVFEFPE